MSEIPDYVVHNNDGRARSGHAGQALAEEHEEFNRSLGSAVAAAGLLPYVGVALEALLRNMLEESEDLHGRTRLTADGQIVMARSNADVELASVQRAEAVRRMLA